MNDTATAAHRPDSGPLRVALRAAFLLSLATLAWLSPPGQSWMDGLSQGPAMLLVIVFFGLILVSLPLHLGLAVASLIQWRRRGLLAARPIWIYLALAALAHVAAIVALETG